MHPIEFVGLLIFSLTACPKKQGDWTLSKFHAPVQWTQNNLWNEEFWITILAVSWKSDYLDPTNIDIAGNLFLLNNWSPCNLLSHGTVTTRYILEQFFQLLPVTR